MKHFQGKKGEGGLMGVVVFIIILVTAAIPIVMGSITAGNYTGIVATILNNIPTMLAIVGLVVVAKMVD